MKQVYVTIIPAGRISVNAQPEVRIFSNEAARLALNIDQNSKIIRNFEYDISTKGQMMKILPSLSGIKGDIALDFNFYDSDGKLIEQKSYRYEIIDSPCNSTTLIDGCWVGLCHWSDDEGHWFNNDLKKLTNEDWKDQIYAMYNVGINGILIQNLFYNNEYVAQHDMTVENYRGQAFYPSELYKSRYPIAAEDPFEAILSAADECNMQVFAGVGLFAWFDYSPESLKWHIEVTKELNRLYGHHPSLYAWYMSEEMFGSLYYDYPPVENEKYKDVVNFFKEYRAFVNELTPTKPVALAPNNIRFHEFAKEWKEILANIDIVIPFAFARDLEHLNIDEIAEICKATGTHFYVDMEMFQCPFDDGLKPKTCGDLIKEIRIYDKIEQIFGYQFTGIMNPPESKFNLGGESAKKLYKEYSDYYKKITILQ